jgi:hypothetical protein
MWISRYHLFFVVTYLPFLKSLPQQYHSCEIILDCPTRNVHETTRKQRKQTCLLMMKTILYENIDKQNQTKNVREKGVYQYKSQQNHVTISFNCSLGNYAHVLNSQNIDSWCRTKVCQWSPNNRLYEKGNDKLVGKKKLIFVSRSVYPNFILFYRY